MTYGRFSDFDYIVTDQTPEKMYFETIERSGAKLLIAQK